MKKLILTVMLIIASTSSSFSQQGWFPTNASQAMNYGKVYFINPQTGWVTSSLYVYKTTNGGLIWNAFQFETENYSATKIFFQNENTGWITAYKDIVNPACLYAGSIYYTSNGGVNWIRKIYSECLRVMDITFLNENTGFNACSNEYFFGGFESLGAIEKTTNAGLNWTVVTQSNKHHFEFHKIAFKNSLTGYALGYYWDDTSRDTVMLFKTTNSGDNWERFKNITSVAGGKIQPFYSPLGLYVKNNNIYIMGKDSVFLRSTDEGINWQKIYYVPFKRHMDFNFINSDTGWIVFQNENDTTNIMKTTTGGANWFNVRNPFSNLLRSIMFVNDMTGYAVGNGVILKSVTGGITDVKQISDEIPNSFNLFQNYPNPFNGISVIRFSITQSVNENVKLSIYDAQGKFVETLINNVLQPGEYEIKWDSKLNASGVYFYKLELNEFSEIRRMVLIK